MDDLISDRPTSTREMILRGAWLCFQEQGPDRTTIAAISRRARVSRGTVYQYFPDKEAVFRATSEQASQTFYAAMANQLASAETLHEQLGEVAAFVVQSKGLLPSWGEAFDAERVALLTTVYSTVLLTDFIAFLSPYLEIAKTRGEVRADLDVRAAAEWLARLFFSLFTTPSPQVDLDDPDIARAFVEDFAVAGLQRATPPATSRAPGHGLGVIASALSATS
jgi:AcrR family transcriptional regulator